MSLARLNRTLKPRLSSRCFATSLKPDDEYTASPQYPQILDLSFKKKLERKKESIYEEIKAVKTVEEKQIKLNMPRYYGFKSYMIDDKKIPYNSLHFMQHITRTHLIANNKLPEFYNSVEVPDLSGFKIEVEEALAIELDGYQKLHDLKKEDLGEIELENLTSASVSKSVNRVILNKLSRTHSHLKEVEVDIEPRVETFWYVGGMMPPRSVRGYRKSIKHLNELENEPSDRLLYFTGSSSLALRSNLPLQPLVSANEAENMDLEVPFFEFDPRVLGIMTDHKHMANVPGFWPGDSHKFGLLTFNKRGQILNRKRFNDPQDDKESLHSQGISMSYAYLHAQANYLGFTTFNDITYPLVTQTVITNGQLWSFYAYQLNTILLNSNHINENPKKNICWATDELKLYDDLKDGKIVNLNEDVLSLLLKFYSNAPESRLGVNLTPYLSNDEKIVADYKDDKKREWLEREYKHVVSNRPRQHELDEIYSWEKIYKIDHKTRHMEKRLRPFELFQKPYQRRLDEREPKYIPRKLRPDLPRHRGRYAKEFFP